MHARKINDRLTLSIAFFLGLSVFTNGIYRYNLPAYQFHNSAKQLDNQGPILSFFNGPFPASCLFIFVFSNKHYYFYNKYMWKMSSHYIVLGFEPTTFRTWVSSHNHWTRAPAQYYKVLRMVTVLTQQITTSRTWDFYFWGSPNKRLCSIDRQPANLI